MKYPLLRIRRKQKGKVRKIINSCNARLRRMALFSIVFTILPISVGEIPLSEVFAKKETAEIKSNLVANFDSDQIVSPKMNISTITPGESNSQKELNKRTRRNTISRESRHYNDPADLSQVYQRAENIFGVDARLIEAVHYVETGKSKSTSKTSYAGARGPMQFMPSTWSKYAIDGNNDGSADIDNVEDAIYAAARYLKASGYPDTRSALWSYNPSSRYYARVMEVAQSLGM